MSLGNDYLALIDKLWDIEEFNMWNPKAHLAVAYLLDRLYGTKEYQDVYNELLVLARHKDYNNLAIQIIHHTVDVVDKDINFPAEEKKKYFKWAEIREMLHKEGELTHFDFIEKKMAPEWFWGVFMSHITLEEIKREKDILQYLESAGGMTREKAKKSFSKLYTHYDLLNEFLFYVRNNRFKEYEPITVTEKMITAKHLYETTYLSPIGAYNFMIYLREFPDEALKNLKNGLPRK